MKKNIIYLCLAVFFSITLASLAVDPVPGWKVVEVYDGDTVVVAKMDVPAIKLRLADIDAPEHDQPYSAASKNELEGLLKGCDVHFMPQAVDRYGRNVARVYACGKDVNAAMVRAGAAWVYARYNTNPSLPPLEAAARAEKHGLWADPAPVNPEEWRHQHMVDKNN